MSKRGPWMSASKPGKRSSVSREQLVAQLQQWCLRAEQSGVKALEDMSVRLRSYAGVRAPA